MDPTLLSKLIQWYWEFGVQRQGSHKLEPAIWLDQLYQQIDTISRLVRAQRPFKPCAALWGPSQSGKSTLLTRYIDFPSAGRNGFSSALQWRAEDKIRFSGDESACSDDVILNPYNAGSDASYCISRFTLADAVSDPSCPVEIRLITHAHLLQFLSQGYHSECDRRDSKGLELNFDLPKFEERLPTTTGEPRPVDPAAYQRLHELADILDALIQAQLEQYKNLGPNRNLVRRKLLECSALNSDLPAVDRFAAQLLWDDLGDGSDPITESYRLLRRKLGEYESNFGSRRILCSYRVAKLLLSSDTYHRLSRNPPDEMVEKLRKEIREVKCKVTGTEVLIGGSEGTALFASSDEAFALFQGVIGELVFPLNRSAFPERSKGFCEFLNNTDLLDFPGVARSESTQALLTKRDLEGAEHAKILTQVLKRGKTAAIADASGRVPTIDSFCILSRIDNFPSNTAQLTSGVRSWLKGLGLEDWPPRENNLLPLNFVFTFSATMVNDVIKDPTLGLDRFFEKIGNIGAISKPSISRQFLVTYPEFPTKGGQVDQRSPEKLELAERQIAQSADFKGRFSANAETLHEMIENGGTDFLLRSLREQVAGSKRSTQIASQLDGCADRIKALLVQASPTNPETAALRQQEIQSWRDAIVNALESNRKQFPNKDAPAQISENLRRLLNVPPDDLQPIPLRCAAMVLDEYVETQFERWRQIGLRQIASPGKLGFKDSAQATRILGYLYEHAIGLGQIIPWIRANFGSISDNNEARWARRFLALKMSDTLAFGADSRPPHRQFSQSEFAVKPDPTSNQVQPRLHGFAIAEREQPSIENDRLSPHYLGFIAQFLRHLDSVGAGGSRERPPQSGDLELIVLTRELGM